MADQFAGTTSVRAIYFSIPTSPRRYSSPHMHAGYPNPISYKLDGDYAGINDNPADLVVPALFHVVGATPLPRSTATAPAARHARWLQLNPGFAFVSSASPEAALAKTLALGGVFLPALALDTTEPFALCRAPFAMCQAPCCTLATPGEIPVVAELLVCWPHADAHDCTQESCAGTPVCTSYPSRPRHTVGMSSRARNFLVSSGQRTR